MWKSRLFTPGPAPVPDEILLEMAGTLVHHRTPQFRRVLGYCFRELKNIFQTSGDVYILTASGTGAMEAAVVNTISPGDRCLVVDGGKFGERFGKIAIAFGAEVLDIRLERGRSVDPGEVGRVLGGTPGVKAVFLSLCETSTGAHNDPRPVAETIRRVSPGTLLVVDGISALGAVECRMDDWGIDVLVSGSQKALMLPPGLSFIALSPKAWEIAEKNRTPSFYFNLEAYRKSLLDEDTPWTPALTLVIGLARALKMISEEGIENVWKRHETLARATRAAGLALGLEPLAENPSSVLSAFRLPEGVNAEHLVKSLRDGSGITFAGGQDELKGKIIRIAHLGWVDRFDIMQAVSALEFQLRVMGHEFTPGAGSAAAQGVFLE